MFLSLRFGEGGAQAQADWLRGQLVRRGVTVYPSAVPPVGTSRREDIADGIFNCDVFVFFGQKHYGQNTGNPMCSFHEFEMACDEAKPLAWINMMGDPPDHKPDANTVRMALPGAIYHKWDPTQAEDEAAVEFVMQKL